MILNDKDALFFILNTKLHSSVVQCQFKEPSSLTKNPSARLNLLNCSGKLYLPPMKRQPYLLGKVCKCTFEFLFSLIVENQSQFDFV